MARQGVSPGAERVALDEIERGGDSGGLEYRVELGFEHLGARDACGGLLLARKQGRTVAPDGDPVDYTTFSLVRLLRRRAARVRI